MQILKFKPILKERIWGGDKLREFGKQIPVDKKIGESWELSAVQGELSVVSEGILQDNNIEELVEIYMGDLVGDKVYDKYGIEFPLLIKFIDAREKLSVQVHPNDSLAKERHHSYGKTEMWYVVDHAPGAELYVGFKEGVTKEQYLKSQTEGRLEDILMGHKVNKGDMFFVPAGTVHAIGKDIMVVEIQQTSDITYRLFDYNRLDDKGNPRELHTDLALDAIDFTLPQNRAIHKQSIKNQPVELINCPYFHTNLLEVNGRVEREYITYDSFVVCIALEGEMTIEYESDSISLKKGETILIPASIYSVHYKGEGKLLETYIP